MASVFTDLAFLLANLLDEPGKNRSLRGNRLDRDGSGGFSRETLQLLWTVSIYVYPLYNGDTL
jgi:hypothetical protein